MWTPESRKHYDRKGLRDPSDMTNSEWALIQPLSPPVKFLRAFNEMPMEVHPERFSAEEYGL